MKILVEPKNALVKQYQRFFNYDDIELVFTEDALLGDRGQGARAGDGRTRAAVDHRERAARRDVRELPSRKDVSKCVITKETIHRA